MNRLVPNVNFAHRGLHDKSRPENSLSAFSLAVQKGYGIELDVHLLSSGEIAVFHDDTTIRCTGKEGLVTSLTRDDLKTFFLCESKETIPLLSDVLKLVNGSVPLLIEIKNTTKDRRLEQTLGEELSSYKGQVLIQSFNPFSLRFFAKNFPEYLRGQLACHFEENKMNFMKRFLTKNLFLDGFSRPDFISYDKRHLDSWRLKHIHKPIFAWAIQNKNEQVEAMKVCTNIIFENFEPEVVPQKNNNK